MSHLAAPAYWFLDFSLAKIITSHYYVEDMAWMCIYTCVFIHAQLGNIYILDYPQGVSQGLEEENIASSKDCKHIDDVLESITVRFSAFLCLSSYLVVSLSQQ